MSTPITNGLFFLIDVVFQLYLIILWLRLVLQARGAYFYNPITLAVFRLTQPIVRPLQRYIPGYRNIDGSVLLLLIAVAYLKLFLIAYLSTQKLPHLLWLLVWALADLANLLLSFYFFTIIIRVIISWLATSYNAFIHTLSLITEPLMKPARNTIPPISGIDLSPLVLVILIELTRIVLVQPWEQYASWLAVVS